MNLTRAGRFSPALFKADTIVFIASFCVMVIELIAARLLAPYIGVSLYTWTSIIGTILASIALGNYLGGKLADRSGSPVMLAIVLLAGSLTTIGILMAIKIVMAANWFGTLPPMANFTLKTAAIFFLPAFVLSMVSPVAIKLTLADLGKTGGIVGTIYAISTAGAILGTYLTGFYFILWFGLRMIVWLVAGILVLTAIFAWLAWRLSDRWQLSARNLTLWLMLVTVLAAGTMLYQSPERWQVAYTRESNYYSIQVRDIDGKVKALALDHLIHSYVIPDEPESLQYAYLKVFEEIVRYINPEERALKTLHLGGGGYSFPRYLAAAYPGSQNDVVEIDAAVTEVVYAELGLPRDTTIRTYNIDARLFLVQRRAETKYNIVIGDIFNDYATPYHLTTVEFDQLVKANLATNGVYLINIIDNYERGRFMFSVVRTLKQVFRNVYLFGTGPGWEKDGPATFVLAATDRDIDLNDLERYTAQTFNRIPKAKPHDEQGLEIFLEYSNAIILTDDHAPTDVLLAQIIGR